MKPMSMEEVRLAIHGHRLTEAARATISAVTTDTRTAQAGDLFVAIRGDRFDGHIFLPQAAQKRCAGAVVRLDSEPRPEIAAQFRAGLIGVGDTVKALGDLAAFQRGRMRATVVGVTGSNGKTTVKRMIHHILRTRLSGVCSPKSFNNAIGVPLSLLDAGGGEDYVVCELGTSAPGEIAHLAGIAAPAVAVITSVSETHLAGLGSLERVIAEKASMLAALPSDGLAVVWAGDPTLVRLAESYGRRVVTFGQVDRADLRVTAFRSTGRGQRFQINGRSWVDLPLPGEHNASNALAAIAVAQRFGFSRQQAGEALADFAGEAMRLEWIPLDGATLINDAYNANPASMLAAAKVLSDVASRRRIMVAGDMGELGDAAVELHLRTGRQIARTRIDLLIGVGPLGRYIAQGAAEVGIETATYETVDSAGSALASDVRDDDAVLIKASRSVGIERIVEHLRAVRGAGGREAGQDRPPSRGSSGQEG
jgi:UDP-N-acetylmuramoyl-tripeptide--D-alanyl-D-alanine ligase